MTDPELDSALGAIGTAFGAPLCHYCFSDGAHRPGKGVEYTELDTGETRWFDWAPCLMSWLKAHGVHLVSKDTNDHHNETKVANDTRPRKPRYRR